MASLRPRFTSSAVALLLAVPLHANEVGKVVGAYVQLEQGRFRIAWAPKFGSLHQGSKYCPPIEGSYPNVWVEAPGMATSWCSGASEGNAKVRSASSKTYLADTYDWIHAGSTHLLRTEQRERSEHPKYSAQHIIVYKVLYLQSGDFLGVRHYEFPGLNERGLEVWKSLSLRWSLAVSILREAGVLDEINDANLLGRAFEALRD